MILPERVFGRPGANWIWSGERSGRCPCAPPHSSLAAPRRSVRPSALTISYMPCPYVVRSDDAASYTFHAPHELSTSRAHAVPER